MTALLDDAALVRPTVISGVPYFYDRVYRRLREEGMADKPGVLKRLLGGRIRTCFSGGAALPLDQRSEPLLHGHGSAHRADGVVFAHAWDAEDRLHSIAEKLGHRAAMRLDQLPGERYAKARARFRIAVAHGLRELFG